VKLSQDIDVMLLSISERIFSCNQPTQSTQCGILLGLLNRVPALIRWCRGRNVTSVE